MSLSPAPCPVCGSVGARALMLDHIEKEHPGKLVPYREHEELGRRYRELQELSGSAIVRANVARGHRELSEAKLAERVAELEVERDALLRAIRRYLDTPTVILNRQDLRESLGELGYG